MARRNALRALAERVGILSSYTATDGQPVETRDSTREALLAAMGFDASSEVSAGLAFDVLCARERDALIDPVQVIPEGEALRIPLRLDPKVAARARFQLSITREHDLPEAVAHRRVSARGRTHLLVRSPALPCGEHIVNLRIDLPSGARELKQTYLVAPRRALDFWQVLKGRPAFGLWANLYSLRSENDAQSGIGDLGTLRSLIDLTSDWGGAFVGISPLHSIRNRDLEISPYGPVSRLFRNPLYLDPRAIPEWNECAEARAACTTKESSRLARLSRIDYERVATEKRAVLELLHRAFRTHSTHTHSQRGRAYREYRKQQASLLDDFATFQALEDDCALRGLARDWRAWPAELRDPRSSAVQKFREDHPQQVDFHAWCQFEFDRQLGQLARSAADAGLSIGLYSDLAVGSLGSGFDAWAFPGMFANGIHLGAPPDDYAASGQDWGFPPLQPHRLRESAYLYWRLLLRAGFEHAGALRIDHALGLYRQYWVPAGGSAADGAYVRFPTDDLLRLIALESQRQQALVIAEDLGTVPEGFPALLARYGVLSTRVLLFERDEQSRFRAASRYSKRALVTAHTHDHPPLAGFWRGRDLDLRHELGDISSHSLLSARARRERELQALKQRLGIERGSAGDDASVGASKFSQAAYQFLARTPAPLIGVSVDDLAEETEPVNLPGVPPERYPSWTRRMREPLERIFKRAQARAILSALSEERSG